MSDRLYLYNKAEIASNEDPCQPFMEWGYEFPLMLQPLVSSRPRIEENSYNYENDELGLYADAAGGIAALRRLYEFIDKHAEALVDDIPTFQKARQKIFQLLDERARHPWFHLDASSIFYDLSTTLYDKDDELEKVARWYFSQVQKNNDCIQRAIEQDNPDILNECPELAGESWSNSFREMLNFDWYEYGWLVITSMIFDLEEDDDE